MCAVRWQVYSGLIYIYIYIYIYILGLSYTWAPVDDGSVPGLDSKIVIIVYCYRC